MYCANEKRKTNSLVYNNANQKKFHWFEFAFSIVYCIPPSEIFVVLSCAV